MKNLTVAQFLNICGLFVFCLLTLMFAGFYYSSKSFISPDSDFTVTLLSIAFVMFVIFIVFVILTIRSFLYPYNEPQPTASFDELFEK